MQQLEHTEVRGITIKTAVVVLCATISVIATVLGTYFSIISRMDKADSYNQLQDMRLHEAEVRLDRLEIDIKEMKDKHYKP